MRPESLEQQIPFRLHVWHRDGLSTDRISVKLRAPPTTTGAPANVFLQVPDEGSWPEFDLRKNENQWTVIDIDEIGRLGGGSLGLDLILDPVSDPVEELAVRTEVEFSESGIIERDYQATANTQFDVLSAQS